MKTPNAADISARIGANFGACLREFETVPEMSSATGIPASSLNHILRGRRVLTKSAVEKYDALCRAALAQKKSDSQDGPDAHVEERQDTDVSAIFLVSCPARNVRKLQKLVGMIGCEALEVEND